jgi:hypothetical protein
MGEVWLRAGVLTQVSNGGEETARLLFVETKQNRTEAQRMWFTVLQKPIFEMLM